MLLDSDSRDSRQPGVHWILEDRNGEIWIAASGSGVYRIFKDGHITRYGPQQQSAFANPVALLEDRKGHLWVGTRAGLCLIDSTPGTEKLNVHLYRGRDGLAGNIVVFLLETRDGHLWISMVNGLTEYDGESFRSYDTRNGLSGIQLTKMFEDRDGNLWIGTQSDGLMKFARNGFITYGAADDKSLTDIKNVFEDEVGNLFVVSTDWSLDRITAKGVYSSRLNMPADATTAWLSNSVLRDHAGEFWAVTVLANTTRIVAR